MPNIANLNAAVRSIIASEVRSILEPYFPMIERLAKLIEGAPARSPGRPRKAAGRRSAPGRRATAAAESFHEGQKVTYKQGRGEFEATVKSVDAAAGTVVLKRDSDGKVVSRPAHKVGLAKAGARAKASAKPAAPAKRGRKAAKAKAKAPKAELAASKEATAEPAARKTQSKRGATGFMKPLQPDETIAEIIGSKPLPRGEVTKKVWDYIKKNGLQDDANKRMINADEKLGKVFGGKKQVSMFEMTKLVAKHLA